ncbi:hypothetical protein BaRGS_00035597 [Batillaria attramentaria]|uniref:ABC transporter domain-containing protein n=1 Tax=Batillaria attramentaria TaxID=370345 RepID=A0ABD0JE96_9CAEN
MGYCPQFDAIHELMTARETLTMYARIRGLQSADIGRVVNHLIDILTLSPYADNLARTYSGGNRRKLSTAIALVGHPHFILLDEPSSGMDAGAKRVLWEVLSDVRASGRTLVLTSHSMEECEALCTKVAIMVNGSFVCLGSTQHLKTKFAQGYTLIAKMELGEDGTYSPHKLLLLFIKAHFPGAYVFDEHDGYVPDPDVRLADLFELMEEAVRESATMHVQEYNLLQTSLEQVFLLFTRKQRVPITLPSMFSFACCGGNTTAAAGGGGTTS